MGGISTRFGGIAAGIGGLMLAAIGSGSAAPPPVAVLAEDGRSLCTPPEVPLFSCAIGTRRASVCAHGSTVVYRYGRPGRIERASRRLTLAERGHSGGGETQITATSKGYSHIVFDRTMRTGFGPDGRNDPQSDSGLIVRQGERTISARMCDGEVPIAARARAMIPAGPFVPH